MPVDWVRPILEWLLLIPVVGGSVFAVLCLLAVMCFCRRAPQVPKHSFSSWPPVTLLKPVYGLEKNLRENLRSGQRTRLLAVEPDATPSLTRGVYAFDYGDTAQMAPIVKMHTLGHSFIPASIHAGGLRYHGMAPSLCALYDAGLIDAVAVAQKATFDAAVLFTRSEGIVPAPESAHAIRAAVDEALLARQTGEKKVILFNLSGHGHFDLSAYDAYNTGQLQDYEVPEEMIQSIAERLPSIPDKVLV